MELTQSWKKVFPKEIAERYLFAETRNAAAILEATEPGAFQDIVGVLLGFELTLEKLTTPGGSKSVIAKELDDSFRERGWREARFEQDLTTRLTLRGWQGAEDPALREGEVRESKNSYGGHWVDNVKGRAVLDIEWNPKDGNLDRDLGNYVSLYEGGILDAGVIVTRGAGSFRDEVRSLIEEVKAVEVDEQYPMWRERMRKLADDPYKTSTTANFEKLEPRVARGDGRGCPILAIGIPFEAYVAPEGSIEDEVQRLARELQLAAAPVDLQQGSGNVPVEFSGCEL